MPLRRDLRFPHISAPLKTSLPTTRFGRENNFWGQISRGHLRHGAQRPPLCNPEWTLTSLQGHPSPTSDPVYRLFPTSASYLQLLVLSRAGLWSFLLPWNISQAAAEWKRSSRAFLKDLGNLSINQ